ncbi:MAG: 4-hydroxybutyryl-CoA dehydratase [Nitrososphaeraceae archaeon]|nr:4-hydroxybutyryl-CoA dehydratase [Nitrososphaeraceae archaeon]
MPIKNGAEYIESLRGRKMKVYLFGQLVQEPVDHPMIRPSINAVAETYDLANEETEIASAQSSLIGIRVNRFLHITESVTDVVNQNKMQRKLGQLTGTCFQRCVGMDALNSLYSTTFEIDAKHGTVYHKRLIEFIKMLQRENLMIGGAMTDVKGDRSLSP